MDSNSSGKAALGSRLARRPLRQPGQVLIIADAHWVSLVEIDRTNGSGIHPLVNLRVAVGERDATTIAVETAWQLGKGAGAGGASGIDVEDAVINVVRVLVRKDPTHGWPGHHQITHFDCPIR